MKNVISYLILLAQIIFLIKTGLDLDLYDLAFTYINLLIKRREESLQNLDKNEQQLFMKASKEKFNLFRDGWKNLLDFEQNETDGNFIKKEKITQEIGKLELKIKEFCQEMINKSDKLKKDYIDNIDNLPSKIFYMKIKADYYRYLAEIANEEEFPEVLKEARDCYEEAYKLCTDGTSNIAPQDALALSVVLNYTVFLYFILDDTRFAFGIADKAYKAAMCNLTLEANGNVEKDPEVEVLIKRIEENLTIWKIELFDIN